jgi:hypothetical protein
MAAGIGDEDVDAAKLGDNAVAAAFIAGVSAASAWKTEAPIAKATSSSGSRRRPISATSPPSLAIRRATAAPMPVPPPVMTTVLPANLLAFLLA